MISVDILNNRNITKGIAVFLLFSIVFALSVCGTAGTPLASQESKPVTESDSPQVLAEPSTAETEGTDINLELDTTGEKTSSETNEETAEETTVPELKMKIDGQELTVSWEDNESVGALMALVSDSPVTVKMSMYGGFEQVGSFGTSLPRNDIQTTTQAGDIVLYSGNQIVVFYGSNSWAYTRLGKIDSLSNSELKDIFGNDAVELILFTE